MCFELSFLCTFVAAARCGCYNEGGGVARSWLRVIRFTNAQVNREFDAVCRAIDAAVREALDGT